jgi:putative transposase
MRAKRYTAEQIVAKLREAEKLQAQGLTIPPSCTRLGISEQTFYRWRIKYGALKEDEAQRLKALEQENSRLKKIVAEQALDMFDAEGSAAGKMVSPTRRRDAVCYLVGRHKVSERRACRVVGQYRSTQRYQRLPAEYELRLVARMNELAAAHPRWGYRRVWSFLRVEGWLVNRKRIERLWRLEGHRVPPRRSQNSGKRAQGTAEQSVWNLPATGPNHVWSYDFMSGRTRDGSPIRILNVVDEYTRVALGSRVARSIGARDVISELERLFDQHGKPAVLRSDNGREFIAESLAEWLAKQGVKTAFSNPPHTNRTSRPDAPTELQAALRAARLGRSLNMNGPKAGGQSLGGGLPAHDGHRHPLGERSLRLHLYRSGEPH